MKFINYYPAYFRERNIWVLWRLEKDQTGRLTKIPYSAKTGYKASSTDPATWSSFSEARAAYECMNDCYDGLGIVLSKDEDLVFIDIDHVKTEQDTFSEAAIDLAEKCPVTYLECSQSKNGIHIFVRGKIDKGFKNSIAGVEMYSEKRFCALTGTAWSTDGECREPVEAQEFIDYVYSKYNTGTRKSTPNTGSRKKRSSRTLDKDIVWKACRKSGAFTRLHKGDWESDYDSQSEADLAYCGTLAFWCDRDMASMDRIFRSSGLMREKWDEKHGGKTYGQLTLEKACRGCQKSVSEYKTEKDEERKMSYEKRYLDF